MDEVRRKWIRERADAHRGVKDRALCAQFGTEAAEELIPELLDELERLAALAGREDLGSKLADALEAEILRQPQAPEDVVLHKNVRLDGITAMFVPGSRDVRVQVMMTLGAPPR